MATEKENGHKAIVQAVAETTRAALQAMATDRAERTQYMGTKLDRPIMKQLTVDWNYTDKYAQLRKFKLEVKNMFQNYSIIQAERLPIIKNWLGRKGPQLLGSVTQAEQEVCDTEGLFEILSNKFKPQYNETIKSL